MTNGGVWLYIFLCLRPLALFLLNVFCASISKSGLEAASSSISIIASGQRSAIQDVCLCSMQATTNLVL